MDHINPSAASSVPWPLVQRSNKATAMVWERGPASRIASASTRAAIRKMNSQPASRAGASSGANPREPHERRRAAHLRAFLELAVDLQHARRAVAHAIGQVADDEGPDEDAEGAVERDRQMQEEL